MLVNKFLIFSIVIVTIFHVFCKETHPPVEIDSKMIENPQSDVVFKKIIKNKNVLLAVVSSARDTVLNSSKITHVELLDSGVTPETGPKKAIFYDVLCNTSLGIQFIVEIQRRSQSAFPKRSVFDTIKFYSKQMDKYYKGPGLTNRTVFDVLEPIHYIVFDDFNTFEEDSNFVNTFGITHKKTENRSIEDEELSWTSRTYIDLPKIKKITNVSELTTPLQKFSYFLLFNSANETYVDGLKTLAATDPLIKQVLKVADMTTWTKEEIDEYEREKKFQYMMGQLAAGAWEEGKEEGREEGREAGKKERDINVIKNMLKKRKSIDTIASILGWTFEDTDTFITVNNIPFTYTSEYE